MGGEQQVHARRAARQLLLPYRDLMVRHWCRDQHDQLARVMGELTLLFVVSGGCVRILLGECLPQDSFQGIPLVVGDRDEAPRRKLAMIRRSRRNRQDSLQFLGGRPWTDQLAWLSRTA